jgi:hypothetical protein
MSNPNTLWLASAIWLIAMGGAAALLGVRSWGGSLTFVLAGTAPILIAARFWRVPEPSLSQSIQRELR